MLRGLFFQARGSLTSLKSQTWDPQLKVPPVGLLLRMAKNFVGVRFQIYVAMVGVYDLNKVTFLKINLGDLVYMGIRKSVMNDAHLCTPLIFNIYTSAHKIILEIFYISNFCSGDVNMSFLNLC